METFMSFVDSIKAWIYKCSLIVFLLNLYTNLFSATFLTVVGYVVSAAFIIDIIDFVVSCITTTNDGEWNVVGVISFILNIALLIVLILMCLFPNFIFEILGTVKSSVDGIQMWWIGTCIVLYNTIHEIISLPLDLIALGTDDGEY